MKISKSLHESHILAEGFFYLLNFLLYGTDMLASGINQTGKNFLFTLDPHKKIVELTEKQISMILSLQGSLSQENGNWYTRHTPNSQFFRGEKPTTSKLVMGKIRKRFLALS